MKNSTMILISVFVIFVVLRIYQLETRLVFGWDQVVNSWVMKDMFLEGKLPLLGMVAKQNTGFYIGPAYYYLLAPFYLLLGLHPIASGIFALIMSLITGVVFYMTTLRLYTRRVGLIAIGIYAVSQSLIVFDRIAWPVNLIPLVSTLIYFLLIRVGQGKLGYLPWLALVAGFAFHIHFTAVYFVLIILLFSPFILRHKGGLRATIMALPFFVIWFVPNLLAEAQSRFVYANHLSVYLTTHYHGFHLVRVFQLLRDAVIEFDGLLHIQQIKFIGLLLPLIYGWCVWRREKPGASVLFLWVGFLWFAVPLLIMSSYKGEISNYYFATTRNLAVIILAYLSDSLLAIRSKYATWLLTGVGVLYAAYNIYTYIRFYDAQYPRLNARVIKAISENRRIEFQEGVPESYLYYWYKEIYKLK